MTALTFLNPSRSYDEVRHAVHFLGHDGMFVVRFFVEAGALAGGDTEQQCLAAFDAARGSIQDAARKAYAYKRRDTYTLTAADLR